jgi:CO/xanthine dehydrogenase FAD-binding subunit
MKDYVLPRSVEEARKILRDLGPEGIAVAGATSHGFMNAADEKVGVDLSRAGMAGITARDGGWRIGAMTTIDDLYRHREAGWVLDTVSDAFVSQQIRNVCTLGGNIARVFPWSDFPVVLLALDAVMHINGDPDRTMTSDEYFKGQPARHFQPGDLLVAIDVEALPPGTGFAMRKQKRTEVDFSQATAAVKVRVEQGKIADLRIALGAAVAVPTRLTGLEAVLTGKKRPKEAALREAVHAGLEGLSFRSVAGMSKEYIRQAATIMTGDAILAALDHAGEEA